MVGVEEHAWTAELRDALLKDGTDDTVRMIADGWPAADEQLRDVGDRRLERMNASGIDVPVLSISAPGLAAQAVGGDAAGARRRRLLAGAVSARPDRYGTFATLPISDPEPAVQEFERCVTQLGMVGAMLLPRTGDRYLDHETFRTILEFATRRGADLPTHEFPPRAVRDVHFSASAQKSTPCWPQEVRWSRRRRGQHGSTTS